MSRARRIALTLSLGAPLLLSGCARATLGTWVWKAAIVTQSSERDEVLAFSRTHGVSSLFVADAPVYQTEVGFLALADLVRRGHAQGLAVTWVGGDPSWALTEHHAEAFRLLDAVRRINVRLREAGLPEIESVQYDIEPYLLPAWGSRSEEIEAQYLGLLDELRPAARGAGLAMWVTAPFWFDHQPLLQGAVDRAILPRVDGVVVMAYRSTAQSVADKAEGILRDAEAAKRPVIVALEVGCAVAPESTMCGESDPGIDRALHDVHTRLAGFSSMAGLAVHQYSSWRAAGLVNSP
jgi:hypothetical protein